jgi:hypothetical protein
MKRLLRASLWFVLLLFVSSGAFGKSSGSSSGGTVNVSGYTRKDGTYVAPYQRTAPNSTTSDNWSTKGNVNPITRKAGTKPADSGSTGATASTISTPAPSPTTAPNNSVDVASNAGSPAAASVAVVKPPLANLSRVTVGMTKPQVLAVTGDPNIKSRTSWFFIDRGWVRFKGDVVASVEMR